MKWLRLPPLHLCRHNCAHSFVCVCRYSDLKHSLEVGQGNPRCCGDFKGLHLWVLWMAVIYFIFPSIWSSLLGYLAVPPIPALVQCMRLCCQQIHCCSVQPGWLGAEHRVQPFWESFLLPQPRSSEECLSEETFCTQGAGRNLVLPDVVLPSKSLALGCCSCLWCLSPSPCMGCGAHAGAEWGHLSFPSCLSGMSSSYKSGKENMNLETMHWNLPINLQCKLTVSENKGMCS